MGRILGLDYGEKRIGVALSDPDHKIASPLEGYTRGSASADADHFAQLVAEHDVERIVVGLPLYPSGDESPKSREARRFGRQLAERLRLPVDFYDERYTSAEAEEHLRQAEVGFRKRRSKRDMLAAQITLQSYLDRQAADAAAERAGNQDEAGR